jgi:hypothetical protein
MIGLVHLVWAPLGPGPLRRFLRSYHQHDPGAEHELTIVLNGSPPAAGGDSSREALLAELQGTSHRMIALERAVLDLPAYGEAARQLEHPCLCFLNSYTVILADGWLGHFSRAFDEPGVGLVGASASWESQAEWVRGRPLHWARQLMTLRGARRDYPRFPNPHVRTSAFMIGRDATLERDFERVRDKRSAYLLESGRLSITRRVQERGLRPVVVGCDGRRYDVEAWPASRTFRAGEQENLLIADNQTADYQTSSARRRRRLSLDSWGKPKA